MDAAMLLSWGVVILILAPSAQANASSAGLFEEDILVRLSPGLKDLIRTAGETPRMRRAAESPARSRLWPGGVVPYRMDPTLDARGRDVINAAIQEVNAKSCVRLVPRTNQRDYIRFFIGNGCYSHVGRQGGRQDVSIGRGCEYKGTVIQQIMHVLGFYLEHTRYDRDNYVTIQWENIMTGMRSQFSKRPRSEVDTLGPYDTLSVMHYGSYAFSRDGTLPTITDKSGKPVATRRPNEGMSDLDVTKLNKLYNCAKQPENSDQRMAGFIL